ncbi:MAG: glycosyltransferase family 39 protein [Candidatus Melainabacteria bacterium]|nr:glycosyltransferase family 39 protein [Candidatus Melainabacteria bacterium]
MSLEYEGPSLWAAVELAKGHNIYPAQRLVEAPWVVTIYPPLYFLLGAPFQLLGGGFNLPGLRLISIISSGAAMFFFYRLVRLCSTSKQNVAVGLVLFASYVQIWSGSFKARIDMLGLALCIASLFYFFSAYKKAYESPGEAAAVTGSPATGDLETGNLATANETANRTGGVATGNAAVSNDQILERYLVSILLIVAAIFAKFSSVVILPAVCFYLASRKRFRDMLIYGGTAATISGVLFFLINMMTDGGFVKHLLFPLNAPYSTADLQKHLSMFGVDWPKLFMIPVIGLVWLEKTEDKERLILPFTLVVLSGLLTAYTIGTAHATLNHGLIFYFAVSWLTVVFIEIYPLSLSAGFVCVSALCTYILGTQLQPMSTLSARMERAESDILKQNMKDKTILVEDPAIAILAGARPLYVDVATFLQALDRDEQSLSAINKALSEKQYPAVIININDSLHDKPTLYWPDSFMQTLEANYKKYQYVVGNGDLQQMYVPK